MASLDRRPVVALPTPDGAGLPSVAVARRGVCTQVSVAGELDFATVGALGAAVDEALDVRASILTVDLTACSFIDSSVVALLLRTERRARARRAELVVVTTEGATLQTLRLTGVCDAVAVLVDGPAGRRGRVSGQRGLRVVPDPRGSE